MKTNNRIHTVIVSEVQNLGNGYFINWLYAPEICHTIQPGQFLMLESGQYLKRPFSVYEIRKKEIGILYKVIGSGTEYLSKISVGEKLLMNAPLGKGFKFPESKKKSILIVAGGIGIAAFPLVARLASEGGYKVKILYGARSKNDLVCISDLKKFSEVYTITDDGSCGNKGFVTELLERELKNNQNYEILVCGPTPMLMSVINVCKCFNLNAQVSFEEHMACGYGVCMSCVVQNKDGQYIRTCVEGPVIESNIVLVS